MHTLRSLALLGALGYFYNPWTTHGTFSINFIPLLI